VGTFLLDAWVHDSHPLLVDTPDAEDRLGNVLNQDGHGLNQY
jgi:hypothetical protein